MDPFVYILVILFTVLLSGIVCHFLPHIGTPIVQMAMGVLVALVYRDAEFILDAHLFSLAFVAPLVYYCGTTIEKRTVWKMRRAIMQLSVPLVLVTSLLVGLLLNTLVPAMGLALCLMLLVVLSPTDDVAVDTVERHYHIPETMMELLKCESIFNEVISIVLFQSILAVVITGEFIPVAVFTSFFMMSLGGLVIGLVFSLGKIVLVKWLRSEGIEGLNIHTILGVVYPFIVFLVAEHLHVSGVVAVFVAGLFHTLEYGRDNPDTVHVTITSHNIWQVMAYSLEGAAFVIVGTQLPHIASAMLRGELPISGPMVILVILVVGAALFIVRFLWAYFTLPDDACCEDEGRRIPRIVGCNIFTLAGDRGAVTLATVLSIPLLLEDGSPFPYRDLILTITMGIIVYSNIATHFVLPFFVHKKNEHTAGQPGSELYIAVLEDVVEQIHRNITPETRIEGEIVIHNYEDRINQLRRKADLNLVDHDQQLLFYKKVAQWQYEHSMDLLNEGKIDKKVADYYVGTLHRHLPKHGRLGYTVLTEILHKFRFVVHFTSHSDEERKRQLALLLHSNDEYVMQKLLETDFPRAQRPYRNEYYLMLERKLSEYDTPVDRPVNDDVFTALTQYGLQLELNHVQQMYEAGQISYTVAKHMKDKIVLLEMQRD